tara:strand:+ start:378 stop:548 length:171 start_codon:yes stop_codon:yes gene_type:complete
MGLEKLSRELLKLLGRCLFETYVAERFQFDCFYSDLPQIFSCLLVFSVDLPQKGKI